MTDHELIVQALRELSPSISPSPDRAWQRKSALRVIDCVLSLNRNYDRVVVKRLDNFEKKFPLVSSISDLEAEIGKSVSPHQFVFVSLEYNDLARADTLSGVVNWFVGIAGSGSYEEQLENLRVWAIDARFDKKSRPAIKGFGIAGFQYLRMLFGANTTKPDARIRAWVAEQLGRPVSALEALNLLEKAANEAQVSLRDADTTIWAMLARNSEPTNKRKVRKARCPKTSDAKLEAQRKPTEFFATIHFRSYQPGEIEEINRSLQDDT